jgi:hypothetical protein
VAPLLPVSDDTVVAPAEASALTTQRADPTYAWTIALLPAAAIPFVMLEDPAGQLAGGAVWLLTLVLAQADAGRLEKVGVKVHPAWSLLSGIFYLVERTRKAGSTPAIPITWGAAVASSLAVFIWLVPDTWTFDPAEVQSEIQTWMDSEYDVDALVLCPPGEIEGEVGDTFTCDAMIGDGSSAKFRVTIEDDGYYSWVVIG